MEKVDMSFATACFQVCFWISIFFGGAFGLRNDEGAGAGFRGKY